MPIRESHTTWISQAQEDLITPPTILPRRPCTRYLATCGLAAARTAPPSLAAIHSLSTPSAAADMHAHTPYDRNPPSSPCRRVRFSGSPMRASPEARPGEMAAAALSPLGWSFTKPAYLPVGSECDRSVRQGLLESRGRDMYKEVCWAEAARSPHLLPCLSHGSTVVCRFV